MKTLLFAIVLTAILLPGSVIAQVDQGIDGIGIYADPGAMSNSIMANPGEILVLYILATNISSPDGIAAFEFSLSSPHAHIELFGLILNNDDFNIATFPDVTVGCVPLKDTAAVIELARVMVMVTDTAPAELYIGPTLMIEGGSLGNYLPAYVDVNSVPIFSLYPSSGSIDAPVFRINGEAPVATTSAALNEVKALYR